MERAQYAGYLIRLDGGTDHKKWPKKFQIEKRKPISFLEMAQQNSTLTTNITVLVSQTQLRQEAPYLKLFSGRCSKASKGTR